MTDQEPKITCKKCGSTALVKFGSYKGKQLYWCKSCKSKVNADDTTFHMKTPTHQISDALSMYFEGMSIESIRRQFKQEYGKSPSSATVYEWIQKFTQYAIDSAKDYHPSVGDTWIADETVLRIDGENVWFWDIIDSKTRYLLASRISTQRTVNDAQQLMERAAKCAGKIPKEVITDRLYAYIEGIENAFGGADHRQGGPFNIENNSNLIERFHGTLKARTKVMRGLKNLGSAIVFTEGWLTHYNYLRPHNALHGKTPAEVSGIDYPYKNWDEIIRNYKPTTPVVISHIKRGLRTVPPTHIGYPRKYDRRRRASMPRIKTTR